MKVIDTHVYCLSPRLRDHKARLPKSESVIVRAIHGHRDAPKVLPLAAPESIAQSMERAGIDLSVLIAFPWNSPELCAENNDFLLETTRREPKRFMAVCSVQPRLRGALAEARRCLDAGAVGIKINGGWQGYELEQEVVGELARLVAKKGAYILTHVDQAFRRSPTSPAHLLEVARKNPRTKIVGAHMGGLLGLYASLPFVGKSLGNVWFDTAISETVSMVRHYAADGLADKVVFGTDYPFNECHSQKIVLDRVRKLRLGGDSERKIFSGNFLRLLKKR